MCYSHISKRHSSKMFQTWGTRFEFVAASQTAPARALGSEPQSSRHISLPGKNEWSLPTARKNKNKGAAVWCVFIYVCACVHESQWAGLAAAAKKRNGMKRERCGAVLQTGDVHKGPSVQERGSRTHLFQPAATNLPRGNLPLSGCPAWPGWAHLNNATNKEKVSAEITHTGRAEWGEGKMQRRAAENGFHLCSNNVSLF